MENPDLIEFYGLECPHSKFMERVVSEFEKKHKIIITKLEVWHNEQNDNIMKNISEFKQGGYVPFFYNKETKKFICGKTDLKKLEEWANL